MIVHHPLQPFLLGSHSIASILLLHNHITTAVHSRTRLLENLEKANEAKWRRLEATSTATSTGIFNRSG